jgi:hypothetical protein
VEVALASLREQENLVDQDVALLEKAMEHMLQLREFRYERHLSLLQLFPCYLYALQIRLIWLCIFSFRCSSIAALSVLRRIRLKRNVRIVFDRIVNEGRLVENPGELSPVADFYSRLLLVPGVTQLGSIHPPFLESRVDESWVVPFQSLVLGSHRRRNGIELAHLIENLKVNGGLVSLTSLQELWLGRASESHNLFGPELQQIPWHQLRRLFMSFRNIQTHFYKLAPKLTSLRDLRLKALSIADFHVNCPYTDTANAVYFDVNHPYLEIDFVLLNKLETLEIEGICNHVPISNLVSPSLKALKLYRPDVGTFTEVLESQRSAYDLVTAAKIAPSIEYLELDIGDIENMWHPTAIPGVDVDASLYRFVAALAGFKRLKEIHLHPPYTARSRLQNGPLYRQPASDSLVIRLFLEVTSLCRSLETLSVTVSEAVIPSNQDFSPMNWEARSWGLKTLLTTRQLDKTYELRQIWEGNRRLTMHTKRRAYRSGKKWLTGMDDWILHH